jgi:hypothetical protein
MEARNMEGSGEDDGARMDRERLTQTKRNIRGIEQGIRFFKKTIDRLTTKGVAIPAEYKSTL